LVDDVIVVVVVGQYIPRAAAQEVKALLLKADHKAMVMQAMAQCQGSSIAM
jgi:hypothetical protein